MDETVWDIPMKKLPKSFLYLVPNLAMFRGWQRNLILGCKAPNLSLTFRARLSTAPIFIISVDSPQRYSPLLATHLLLYICDFLGKLEDTQAEEICRHV